MSAVLMGENFNPVRRSIKNGNIFLVTNADGNIISDNVSGYGMYTDDTRFLNRLELNINDIDPIILSSSTESGYSSIVISTNPMMADANDPDKKIMQETIQIKRESIIYGSYFETITISNYNPFDIAIKIELLFEADFLDIFEVRNISSIDRDQERKLIVENELIKFIYQDITGATLWTEIDFIEKKPVQIDHNKAAMAIYDLKISANSEQQIKYQIKLKSTASLPEKLSADDFTDAFEKAVLSIQDWSESTTGFITNNQDFNEMINRGQRDINMLKTNMSYGEYLSAGIPWFVTLFGRDSIITARQCLILNPSLAKNVLITLAKFQGKEENPWKDEEPGKIPHEIRFGELARSNKIPNSPYYGTIDATPLWVILLYDYFKWTNDKEALELLWQNALDCLNWMDNYALILDGYAAYKTKSKEGLENQGWKDSWNSSVHADGSLAETPIALVEVQGYFYAAMMKMAELADYMQDNSLKIRLIRQSQDFKKRFHRDFWIEELQFYAMGLDKDKKPMEVISSNPGHCLETGIFDNYYANIVADRLFQPDMFNGWGIRTLSKNEKAYNPMSYHNGSIWPHDNSIIAYGLSKINRMDLVLKIISAMFESARLMYYKRLPELFCGFSRQFARQDPPVRYPTACIPQAWSAGSIFLFIQSMLNVDSNAPASELKIFNSVIPSWMDYLRIKNLRIGNTFIDMELKRATVGLVIDIIEKRGTLDIIIKK